MSKVEVSEFKGHNVISISDSVEGKYPARVSFGLAKAKLILAHVEDIKKFVANQAPDTNKVPQIPNFG